MTWWLLLAAFLGFSTGTIVATLVTVRRLPVMIARMTSAEHEVLLDRVEAIARGTD